MPHDADLEDDLHNEEEAAEEAAEQAVDQFKRNVDAPEVVRFDEERLKGMTPEELRAHIRILYFRQDQFMEHFGRLHRRIWAQTGYDPTIRGPQKRR